MLLTSVVMAITAPTSPTVTFRVSDVADTIRHASIWFILFVLLTALTTSVMRSSKWGFVSAKFFAIAGMEIAVSIVQYFVLSFFSATAASGQIKVSAYILTYLLSVVSAVMFKFFDDAVFGGGISAGRLMEGVPILCGGALFFLLSYVQFIDPVVIAMRQAAP